LVVIYHYREIIGPEFDRYTSFFEKGYLWVDCFFMLSGFILSYIYGAGPSKSIEAAQRFFRARLARIYPLHIATLLGLVAFVIVLPHISHQKTSPDWRTFWLNVTNIHAWGMLSAYDWNFPSWSISVEFAAYLFYPLAIAALARFSRATTIALTVLFALASMTGREHWERLALLHGLPMFLMGMIIYKIPKLPSAILSLQIASVLSLIFVLHFGLSDALAELCFVGLICSIQWDDGLARYLSLSPLLWLGASSYSIYMLHIPVRIVDDSFVRVHLNSCAYFVLVTVTTLMAATVSYRVFEIPLRNLITGRAKKIRMTTAPVA